LNLTKQLLNEARRAFATGNLLPVFFKIYKIITTKFHIWRCGSEISATTSRDEEKWRDDHPGRIRSGGLVDGVFLNRKYKWIFLGKCRFYRIMEKMGAMWSYRCRHADTFAVTLEGIKIQTFLQTTLPRIRSIMCMNLLDVMNLKKTLEELLLEETWNTKCQTNLWLKEYGRKSFKFCRRYEPGAHDFEKKLNKMNTEEALKTIKRKQGLGCFE
jgi:hypothetical protein